MIGQEWIHPGKLRRLLTPRVDSFGSGGPAQTAVDPLSHALGDPPRNVGSPEAGFAIADFNNSRLILKKPADGLFAEVPENSHLLN